MLGEHQNVVFQFSGGKDSLACLHLLRPYWDRLTVLWCDTGDAFPETRRLMDEVRAMVPSFVAIVADQPANISENGPPTDLLPVWHSPLGRAAMPGVRIPIQSALECCGWNVWRPLAFATHELKATLVIRGQRDAEQLKAPIRSGHIENGVEYLFPLEGWTDDEVDEYLHQYAIKVPDNYRWMKTSLDCQHCTAYLWQNAGRSDYIKAHHPELAQELDQTYRVLAVAAREELMRLEDAAFPVTE